MKDERPSKTEISRRCVVFAADAGLNTEWLECSADHIRPLTVRRLQSTSTQKVPRTRCRTRHTAAPGEVHFCSGRIVKKPGSRVARTPPSWLGVHRPPDLRRWYTINNTKRVSLLLLLLLLLMLLIYVLKALGISYDVDARHVCAHI